jgi:hypothetical protein
MIVLNTILFSATEASEDPSIGFRTGPPAGTKGHPGPGTDESRFPLSYIEYVGKMEGNCLKAPNKVSVGAHHCASLNMSHHDIVQKRKTDLLAPNTHHRLVFPRKA